MAAKKLRPVHPGDILLTTSCSPEAELLQGGKGARRGAPTVNEIVRRRRAITAEMALRLSRYFGTSAQLWQNYRRSTTWRLQQKDWQKVERAIQPLNGWI